MFKKLEELVVIQEKWLIVCLCTPMVTSNFEWPWLIRAQKTIEVSSKDMYVPWIE